MTKILRVAKVIGHPVVLAACLILSVLLWMPFGFGYYGWPYRNAFMRYALYWFVWAYPICCLASLVAACAPRMRIGRVILALFCLWVAARGVQVLRSWRMVYVIPLLSKDQPLAGRPE